jgi:calcineurin-like phosphoesterase family protein
MANIFLCSDHHFSHVGVTQFLRADGVTKLRPFDSIWEMDEYMIARHNSVVRPSDKVYFLGDFTFSKKNIHIAGRLHGDKVLIKGNHDTLKIQDYLPYFRDIRGCHQFDGMFLSHVPIHVECIGRWGINVHGHLHANRVMKGHHIDPRYVSVCMEQLDDYTPISLEQLKQENKSALESSVKS